MSARRHGYRVIARLAAVFFLGACQMGAVQNHRRRGGRSARLRRESRRTCGCINAWRRRCRHSRGADALSRLVNRRYVASAIRAARRHAK